MTDIARRTLERMAASTGDVHDEARVMVERLRSGNLPLHKIQAAALCGHSVARVVAEHEDLKLVYPDMDQDNRMEAWLSFLDAVKSMSAVSRVVAAIKASSFVLEYLATISPERRPWQDWDDETYGWWLDAARQEIKACCEWTVSFDAPERQEAIEADLRQSQRGIPTWETWWHWPRSEIFKESRPKKRRRSSIATALPQHMGHYDLGDLDALLRHTTAGVVAWALA